MQHNHYYTGASEHCLLKVTEQSDMARTFSMFSPGCWQAPQTPTERISHSGWWIFSFCRRHDARPLRSLLSSNTLLLHPPPFSKGGNKTKKKKGKKFLWRLYAYTLNRRGQLFIYG